MSSGPAAHEQCSLLVESSLPTESSQLLLGTMSASLWSNMRWRLLFPGPAVSSDVETWPCGPVFRVASPGWALKKSLWAVGLVPDTPFWEWFDATRPVGTEAGGQSRSYLFRVTLGCLAGQAGWH
jgi:hypothetical protein